MIIRLADAHPIKDKRKRIMITLKTLYQRAFPAVARYVAKMGGSLEDAKDVFHDALLIYYERINDVSNDAAQEKMPRKPEAYVFGVARYIWFKRHKDNQLYASLDDLMTGSEEKSIDWEDKRLSAEISSSDRRILRVLEASGRKCMEILTAFYYEQAGMRELAERFGFRGIRSATVQKFKCLQKVKQIIREKSLRYEDLIG